MCACLSLYQLGCSHSLWRLLRPGTPIGASFLEFKLEPTWKDNTIIPSNHSCEEGWYLIHNPHLYLINEKYEMYIHCLYGIIIHSASADASADLSAEKLKILLKHSRML